MGMDLSTWILTGTLIMALIAIIIGACYQTMAAPRLTPPPLPSQRPWWKNSIAGVPTHPYRWPDLIIVGFLVFLYLGPLLVGQTADSAEWEIGYSTIIQTFISQGFFIGLLGAIMFWRMPVLDWLGLRHPTWKLAIALAPAVVFTTWTISASLEFSGFNDWLTRATDAPTQQAVVSALMETQDPWLLVLLCFMAVIAAPISEEIIFRGYLYPVAKRFSGTVPAAIFSALIFAAIHYHVIALIPLMCLGLLFVIVYEWTGSLLAPIAAHILFNAATVSIQLANRYGWIDLPQP